MHSMRQEACNMLPMLSYYTLRGQKYGNDGPKNAASKMSYEAVENGLNYFGTKIEADVTKTIKKMSANVSFSKI